MRGEPVSARKLDVLHVKAFMYHRVTEPELLAAMPDVTAHVQDRRCVLHPAADLFVLAFFDLSGVGGTLIGAHEAVERGFHLLNAHFKPARPMGFGSEWIHGKSRALKRAALLRLLAD